MRWLDALLNGLVLGGIYALIAMGLTLQYGVARIMNLAYGPLLVAGAFVAYGLFTSLGLSPFVSMALVLPASFAVHQLIYRVLLRPLVRRARNAAALESDSLLATFGLLFVVQGILLVLFGAGYVNYRAFDQVVELWGTPLALNRLIALGCAVLLGAGLHAWLHHTRSGLSLRAVAVSPAASQLVAIDIVRVAALAFAVGGMLVAAAGVLVSMFMTFNANMGVAFTMKALVVVIMGGVGHLGGCLLAGLVLGLTESFVATYVSPGLTLAATYLLFMTVLVLRPSGFFGRAGL